MAKKALAQAARRQKGGQGRIIAPPAALAKPDWQHTPGARNGRPWEDIPEWASLTPRQRVKRLLSQPIGMDDRGAVRLLELARDELYLPSEQNRLRSIPTQNDAEGVLREAEKVATQTGHMPQLVFYPAGAEHTRDRRVILSDDVLMQTGDSDLAITMAQAAGYHGARALAAPGFVVAKDDRFPGAALVAAADMTGQRGIEQATPLLATLMHRRFTPNDPLFAKQWHLKNTGQSGGVAGIDANVILTWDNYQGQGVTIGIVDDGLQYTHPDLAPAYDAAHSYDFYDNDSNPAPVTVTVPDKPGTPIDETEGEWHGTSVAGVAAARGNNGIGVSGVAPRATLAGIRLIDGYFTPVQGADAEAFADDVIAIKNNSWGPSDDTPWALGWMSSVERATLANSVLTGRGGKGTLFAWAAGNGRGNGGQANKDGYGNSIYAFAVGAVNSSGVQSSYSESGANLITSAPSNGGVDTGIVTTDLTGKDGYNPHWDGLQGLPDLNYTNHFGGTSSASPVVAGVMALMLGANAHLGWRDVKEILLRSGKKLSPSDTDWVSRTGGQPSLPPIKHSPKYGGGMVDANAAANLARNWTNLGPMSTLSHSFSGNQPIPDGSGNTIVSLNFAADAPMRVEQVEVTVNMRHPYRGDVYIMLISPSGAVSTLASQTYEDDGSEYSNLPKSQRGYSNWTFSSMHHWGESSVGNWRVVFMDVIPGDAGTVQGVTIRLNGTNAPPVLATASTPTSTLVLAPQPVTMGVTATGYPDISYQWSKSTAAIAGKTASSLTLTPTALSSGGTYQVVSRNVTGTHTNSFNVGVVQPLAATQIVNVGTTMVVQAGVAAPAGTPVTYQWLKNSVPLVNDVPGPLARLSGALSSKLLIAGAGAGDAGLYECVISMFGDTVSTGQSSISIREKPVIDTSSLPTGLIVSGTAVTIPLTFENGITKVTISGLPTGLTYNPLTGTISGIPAVPLTNASVKITAYNLAGSSTVTLPLTVAALDSTVVGAFNGLVDRNPAVSSNNNYGGAITSLVVLSTGTFTGKVSLAGLTYSVAGRLVASLGADPAASLVIKRAAPAANVTLAFAIDRSNGHLTGTLTEAGNAWTTNVEAWHNPYNAKNLASGLAGLHNLWLIPPSGLTPGTSPEGTGEGSATVSPLGAVTLSLKLADGTAISRATTMGPTGDIPLNAMLYANHGSVQGWLNITDQAAPAYNSVTGSLTWNKTAPASATDRSYKTGFDLGVTNMNNLTVLGSEYRKPVTVPPVILWGLTDVPAGQANARLAFSGGGIETAAMFSNINKTFRISTAQAVILPLPNTAKVTLSLNAATGAFSGSATLVDGPPNISRLFYFYGVIAPALTHGRGFFTLPGIPVSTTAIQSGAVEFEAAP